MRHRVLTAVLTLLFSVGCCLPALAAEKQYENLTDLGLTSKSALLMEEDTGTILYEQNSHEALPPASVTKVMTCLLYTSAKPQRRRIPSWAKRESCISG